MARLRKKKTTTSQKIAAFATMSLPAPIQRAASTRIGSRILLILVPILIATGLVTVTWDGWWPRFSLDRKRAVEINQEAVDTLEELQQGKNGITLRKRVSNLSDGLLPLPQR